MLSTLIGLTKCMLPNCDVEVIVVFNGSEADVPEARRQQEQVAFQVEEWADRWPGKSRIRFYDLWYPDLPKKEAGVGLARKIGMDEACYRLEKAGNPKGIIVCYDAGSRCERNYLTALETFFGHRPGCEACAVYFEHPLEGVDFPDEVYTAIAEYELHLRYYIRAQRWAGFPYAFHTVGSSMAVRADAYQRQGGMNRRQAGEDFYFFHKFTALGTVEALNSTRVILSPRPSRRAPFGHQTYNPALFQILQVFCRDIPCLFTEDEEVVVNSLQSWHPTLQAFLQEQDFLPNWREIRAHSSKPETFCKRYFRWFNAFHLVKYLRFAREFGFPDVPVKAAAEWLLSELNVATGEAGVRELLLKYREMDRGISS